MIGDSHVSVLTEDTTCVRSRRSKDYRESHIINVYYYRSRMQIRLHTSVFTIGRKSPGRSQFYSDHRVNFSLYTAVYLANPLPLDRSLFAFILCFYDKKSSKKQQCCENASNGVIYDVLSANVKWPAGLHSANVKRPAGLMLSDPRVAADLV